MLESAQLLRVITTMRKAQKHWAGHVFQMSAFRISKQLLYGELSQGTRKVGRQCKRFKDFLNAYLKELNIYITTWENAASDRPGWRNMIHKGALHSEAQRSNAAKEKRRARKARAENSINTPPILQCQTCGRGFHARIGLISHQQTHH